MHMGVWGPKIYDNDIALDVKDEFEDLYNKGQDVKKITEQLIEANAEWLSDPEEAQFFWLALADVQWNKGVLLSEVKKQAIYWIEKGDCIANYQLNQNVKRENRQKELEKLKDKILSPQPEVKKTKKRRVYVCPWNIGDVFAYQLESDLAKEKGLYGRYLLIQKIDEGTWYPEHIIPIVYVKLTKDDRLPTNVEEYEQAEYVQTWFTRFEDRFNPIDFSRPKEDLAEKSRIEYKVDEFGFLPNYRVKLVHTSKRMIPHKLQFLGNYQNVSAPKNEFVPHSKVNIRTVEWKRFERTFEDEMIKSYFNHNRRELSIYYQ